MLNEPKMQSLANNMEPWETVTLKLAKELSDGDPITGLVIRREEADENRLMPAKAMDVDVSTIRSFVDFINKYGKPEYADIFVMPSREVTCIFNPTDDYLPGGMRDTCGLGVAFHQAMLDWRTAMKSVYSIRGFLDFLRRHVDDISPNDSEILIKQYSKISTATTMVRDMDNDEQRGLYLGYSITSKTGSKEPGKLLSKITINIPVFVDERIVENNVFNFAVNINIDEPEEPGQQAKITLISRQFDDFYNYGAMQIVANKIREMLPEYHVFDC